ncbi:hypothetical protein J5X84_39410 [Streptosporangiaceae bacterium NEAU-GS5]|nr:hypothetical protein [Streptosporangiaceae bacterium NEAU-GS5]
MPSLERIIGSLVVGGIVIMVVADAVRSILWYPILLILLLVLYRLLFGDR